MYPQRTLTLVTTFDDTPLRCGLDFSLQYDIIQNLGTVNLVDDKSITVRDLDHFYQFTHF